MAKPDRWLDKDKSQINPLESRLRMEKDKNRSNVPQRVTVEISIER